MGAMEEAWMNNRFDMGSDTMEAIVFEVEEALGCESRQEEVGKLVTLEEVIRM